MRGISALGKRRITAAGEPWLQRSRVGGHVWGQWSTRGRSYRGGRDRCRDRAVRLTILPGGQRFLGYAIIDGFAARQSRCVPAFLLDCVNDTATILNCKSLHSSAPL